MKTHSSFRALRTVRAVALLALAITASGRLLSEEKSVDLEILRPDRLTNPATPAALGWEDLGGRLFRKSFYLPPMILTDKHSDENAAFEDPHTSRKSGEASNRRTAQEILTEAGIIFAEGTSAVYLKTTCVLTVVQSEDQIAAVESYLATITHSPEKLIHIRAEIYEVSQAQGIQVSESAQSEGEHTPERAALMKAVQSGGVKLIAFPSIICRSGQRALILEELVSAEAEISTENESEKNETQLEDTSITISKLEADAILGADEFTIDLNFSLSISEPLEPGEAGADYPGHFRQRTITTQATLMNGNHQLIGSWRAPGDRVYLVFLSAHLQQIEPVRKASEKSE
jgi:hypothetical protein